MFNFLFEWAVVAPAKRKMCYSSSLPPIYCAFLPVSSDWTVLKDRRAVLPRFVLRSAAGAADSGALAAQDVGAQQLLPVRWWARVFVGLIIS